MTGQDRIFQLTGQASALSWRYEIQSQPRDAVVGSNRDRLHVKLEPVDTGGNFPEGHGLDLTIHGHWEARELVTVLQALVHELIATVGTGFPVAQDREHPGF